MLLGTKSNEPAMPYRVVGTPRESSLVGGVMRIFQERIIIYSFEGCGIRVSGPWTVGQCYLSFNLRNSYALGWFVSRRSFQRHQGF